ncbi:MAG: polyprenyl synthetase family protein [bacterium]
MKLEKLLAENKKRMDERIFSVLPCAHDSPEIALLYDMMRDYPSRKGKGIRGNLCLLSCRMLGGEPDHCLDTAAAIELFESWVLIHDDIEDGSDMRRGDVTLHLKHGVPLALNTGDALNNRMWEILMRNRETLGADVTFSVAQEFLRMINLTTEGQHIELSWTEKNRFDLDEESYYSMCTKKTAWYTCISPLRLGGMVARAEDGILDSMSGFGTDMGLAFQIQDDILNLVGDEKKYGKEIHGDIREGKRTLALIHAMNNCKPEKREKLRMAVGKPRSQRTEEDVQLVLHIMKACGSIDYARGQAARLARSARVKFDEALSGVPESAEKQTIREIIDFVVSRDK